MKKLNPRQAQVIKRVAKGENQTKAYQEAYGCSYDTAKTNASRMLTNANSLMAEVLRKNGVDEQSIADTLKELKHNRDWKAKESYIDRSAKLLGYDQKQETTLGVKNGENEIVVRVLDYK